MGADVRRQIAHLNRSHSAQIFATNKPNTRSPLVFERG
jgi:hypothetical protein